MEFWTETKPHSRKARQCDACGQVINAGEQYAYMAGKYDGEFFTVSQHAECREAEVSLAREHGLWGGEDWIHLNDLDERDDFLWLEENHPKAFARIKTKYGHWLDSEPASDLMLRVAREG